MNTKNFECTFEPYKVIVLGSSLDVYKEPGINYDTNAFRGKRRQRFGEMGKASIGRRMDSP